MSSGFSNEQEWLDCVFDCSNSEEDGARLFELGIGGVELVSDTRIRCVLSDEDQIAQIQQLGLTLVSKQISTVSEWTAKCDELFAPIDLGTFKVLPVRTFEDGQSVTPKDNELLLIPGLGFGTGHHAATRLCAEMLQRISDTSSGRVLDLGTGSGLLAVICAKIFRGNIEAIDIDPMALDNAKENVTLNKLDNRIDLILGGVEKLSGEYSVIVANLYAELLCEFEPALRRHLKKGGALVVSGIMAELAPQIRKTFCLPQWTIVEEHLQSGWAGFRFKV